MSQDTDNKRPVVNTVTNLRCSKKLIIFDLLSNC